MKKLSNTKAELRQNVPCKKKPVYQLNSLIREMVVKVIGDTIHENQMPPNL